MSTDTPLATAPELPTTSHRTAEGDVWNAAFKETNSTTETAIPSARNSPTQAPIINDKMTPTATTTTSSTAYSFSGSALGSETININKDKETDTSNTSKSAGGDKEDDTNQDSIFECNICLDTAKDAVVSMCGHLFCWPCLHQWLETRPSRKLCPVCKAAIGKDKVIPLYGRNSTKQEDPR